MNVNSDAQPSSPTYSSHSRQDSFTSSLSDGSTPALSLISSLSSEARTSSVPSSIGNPPLAGHSVSKDRATKSRRSLSTFRPTSLYTHKSQTSQPSLTSAVLKKQSFGGKLKYAINLGFGGCDPATQTRAHEELEILRTARPSLSRKTSRPGSSHSNSQSTFSAVQQPEYTNKPFAGRRVVAEAPLHPGEVAAAASELDDEPTLDIHSLDFAPVPFRNFHSGFDREPELPTVAEEDDPEMMGLMRSFTIRLQRNRDSSAPARPRPQISLPVEVIMSSNSMVPRDVDQLEPPRPQNHRQTSDSSRLSSIDEYTLTDPGLTDDSSVSSDSSPTSSSFEAERTSYYNPDVSPLVHPTPISPVKASDLEGPITVVEPEGVSEIPPAIPARASTHSKREHVRLARARSVRARSTSRPPPIDQHPAFAGVPEVPKIENEPHPFSSELAQLQEMAKELAHDDDHQAMEENEFASCSANDYHTELDMLIYQLSLDSPAAEKPITATL